MTDTTQNGYMEYKPTLAERFWRALGYRYHLGDDPPSEAFNLPGWACTEIRLHFGILDRLRLLLTGRLLVKSILHHDTPSADKTFNRTDWKIRAPGERDR